MRGTVIHYDEDQDYGYINGVDGKRYIFARDDLAQGVSVTRGALVEFRADDGAAHDIVAATAPGRDPSQRTVRSAESRPAQSMGLWAYFLRAMVDDYRNFTGRARRKEFWGFYLFWTIMLSRFLALAYCSTWPSMVSATTRAGRR
jgi:cold shock CspA family protein